MACLRALSLLAAAAFSAHAAAPSAHAAAPFAHAAATLRMGELTLHRCAVVAAYCADLERPLDPTHPGDGKIPIHFELYPHTGAGDARGTLVATEGGPGYPATQSRDDYLALFGPLRARHDVLLMDNRGTGRSGALNCDALQTAPRWTVAAVAACGRALGAGAALYGTAFAADDLAAILHELGIRRIDLYGDSYGTYFEQVFALRHPARLRSIVLDGAYPLNGPDYAWYPSYAPAMRSKFDLACARSPACARIPGDSISHILPALRRLREQPFAATALDADGRRRHFTADASALGILMFAGSPALASVRETDAAARAFARGDRAPLLRLMAETYSGVDSRDPTANPGNWSAGLAAAVLCQDPPQIFDMNLDPDARVQARDAAIARRQREHPGTYAPFTIDEYRGMPLDYSFIDECVRWPKPPRQHPDGAVTPTGRAYPDIPALVISADLDDMTTVANGAAVAREFPHGHQVVMVNSFHVNALPRARGACAARIVRRFLRTLSPGDTRCAGRIPPLRLVPEFARRADALDPAAALPGNRAGRLRLQVARAALMTVGDVVVRAGENTTGRGPGLRGGSFRVAAAGRRLRMSGVRWTSDVAVSGAVRVPAGRRGTIDARVRVRGPGGLDGSLRISWPQYPADARARIAGILGGEPVRALAPAP